MTQIEVTNTVINFAHGNIRNCGYYQAVFMDLHTDLSNLIDTDAYIDPTGLSYNGEGIAVTSTESVTVKDLHMYEDLAVSVNAYFKGD